MGFLGGVGFLGGCTPKKTCRVFCVRTRVSEPCLNLTDLWYDTVTVAEKKLSMLMGINYRSVVQYVSDSESRRNPETTIMQI